MGLGKYNALAWLLYITLAQVLKHLLASLVQLFGKGPGIFISLVHSTLPQQQDQFLILISFYGSQTTAYILLAWRIALANR